MNTPNLRFSIGSMLLAIAVIALLPAYNYAMTKANSLAEENEWFKKETGFIEVEDPDRLYVRELRCPFESCWQFRIGTPSDKIWIKVGTFSGAIPSSKNVIETGKEHLIVAHDSILTLSLVEKDSGQVNLRTGFITYTGGGGRLEVPIPLQIDLAAKVAGWEHHKKASRWIEDSPSTHGDVNKYEANEFIPLFVIEGDGPDTGKKAVVYLELQAPSGHMRER